MMDTDKDLGDISDTKVQSEGIPNKALVAEALSLFGRVDKNSDGFMSADELKMTQSELLTTQERLVMECMSRYLPEIEEMSNDELGDENDGITRKDLLRLYEAGKEDINNSLSRRLYQFTNVDKIKRLNNTFDFLSTNVDSLDQNNNGSISWNELSYAKHNGHWSKSQNDAIAIADNNVYALSSLSNDPGDSSDEISVRDIAAFGKTLGFNVAEGRFKAVRRGIGRDEAFQFGGEVVIGAPLAAVAVTGAAMLVGLDCPIGLTTVGISLMAGMKAGGCVGRWIGSKCENKNSDYNYYALKESSTTRWVLPNAEKSPK